MDIHFKIYTQDYI